MFYTSQTAISLYRECPRKRYWQFRFDGRGIVKYLPNIHLVWGKWIHEAIQSMLLQNKSLKDVLSETIAGWQKDSKLGFDEISSDYVDEMKREHEDLLRAHVMWFYRNTLPELTERFQIINVEGEVPIKLDQNLTLETKPDAIIIDKREKEVGVLSTKSCESINYFINQIYSLKMQIFTETMGANQFGKQHGLNNCNYVSMLFVAKGTKTRVKEKDAFDKNKVVGWTTNSPLIRGYHTKYDDNTEYAHSEWIENENNASGMGKLGKGWDKFVVSENDELGDTTNKRLLAWQKLLTTGETLGLPNLLADIQQFDYPMKPVGSEYLPELAHSIVRQELKVFNSTDELQYDKYTHSCNAYGRQCEYHSLCWQGAKPDYLIKIKEMKWREPHHEGEKKLYD